MAGRRTPSGRPGSALLRGKRRPAAARRDGRAASLPARLPRCLSPTADGDRSPEPGPGGVSHAPHGSTDNSSPPLSAAALRRLLPPALRCAALRWARPLPARSRSAPPWPGAPPCGPRRDCSGHGTRSCPRPLAATRSGGRKKKTRKEITQHNAASVSKYSTALHFLLNISTRGAAISCSVCITYISGGTRKTMLNHNPVRKMIMNQMKIHAVEDKL